jgi:colanic acid biosynthesis glycosyl transferase WcaI
LKIQLWSIYYDPVPTGIGPITTVWARAMRERGHEVEVVTAHPHYPTAMWGRSRLPRRRLRDGIEVLELPLMVGRATRGQRLRQEVSFAVSQALAAPALATPDVVVAVSPSFPALAPAMVNARLKGIPWVLWLQDILPDGAVSTELLRTGPLLSAARWLEAKAYRESSAIVAISRAFRTNLEQKGVAPERVSVVYNPATRELRTADSVTRERERPARVLSMGNVGLSQGLPQVVKAFEASDHEPINACLVIAGHGVALEDVRRAVATDRVEVPGLLSEDELDRELDRAAVGLVTQRADITEFNLPSKLMTFMARGIPVVASVDPRSEAARLIEASGAGWVTDNHELSELPKTLRRVLADPAARRRAGAAGARFATEHFTPQHVAERFEQLLLRVLHGGSGGLADLELARRGDEAEAPLPALGLAGARTRL